eukprot:COSAG01_NODE_19745_length_992_cov_0.642777_2_plen_75_part_01
MLHRASIEMQLWAKQSHQGWTSAHVTKLRTTEVVKAFQSRLREAGASSCAEGRRVAVGKSNDNSATVVATARSRS